MTATYKVAHAGNIAIQTEVWTLTIEAAKALLKEMKANGEIRPGSYWQSNFAQPVNSAIRSKASGVKIYTAGFSTGEFANKLRCVGVEVCFGGRI